MYHIKTNMNEVKRQLSDVGRKQLPFALAKSLTATAREVADAEKDALPRIFDRPTPFTANNSVYVVGATKARQFAEVGIKRRQKEYLKIQATGGTRRPNGRALIVPVGMRLNKYGNMPRGAIKRAKAKANTFVASRNDPKTRHLAPGIYERHKRTKKKAAPGYAGRGRMAKRNAKDRAPRMLAAFEGSARYRRRFPFEAIGTRRANAVFEKEFVAAFRQAMATSR